MCVCIDSREKVLGWLNSVFSDTAEEANGYCVQRMWQGLMRWVLLNGYNSEIDRTRTERRNQLEDMALQLFVHRRKDLEAGNEKQVWGLPSARGTACVASFHKILQTEKRR